MALDGIVLYKLAQSFRQELPIKINRIIEISSNEIVLNVHHQNKRDNIIIGISANANRIHFSQQNYVSLDHPSNFTMTLRKKLIGGIIYDIIQPEFDRYLIFKIKNLNDLYDEVCYELYVELMGKYANIILVDANNRIVDAFKKIALYENSKRLIQINAKFQKVESQQKTNPFDLQEYNNQKLQGFSPLLEKELNYRLQNNNYQQFIEDIQSSESIFCYQNEFHCIKLTHRNDQYLQLPIHQALDFFYNEQADKDRIRLLESKVYRFIKRELKHYQTKCNKIVSDLAKAENYSYYKDCGDYLFMSGNLNCKGLKEIEVFDYEGNQISIELNEKMNIKDNANKYYQKYQKLKKGIQHLTRELEIAKNKLEYFQIVNQQLDIANQYDIQDIKSELINYGYFKEQNNKAKRSKQKKEIQLYKIQIHDKIILYGKNNIQNAYLTFKVAKKNHTFFHAKDYHGAHVVIDSDQLNEEEIRLCAMIAAYFSGGRNSSSIPIDYCLIKDTKKITGAKVAISNQKTIYIDVDYQVLNQYKIK